MIKVRQVKIDVLKDSADTKLQSLCKKLNVSAEEIINYEISKQSLDARDKENIYYVYEFIVTLKNENKVLKKSYNDILKYEDEQYSFPYPKKNKRKDTIIIVGCGPAGLFAAYTLAENGFAPIIIERGKPVEDRIIDVEKFWEKGILNPNSNVQFGEGGAGAFSDGKLNTLIKDNNYRMKKVFKTFVECGASKEILYSYKPHIGTDVLRNVIINMRNKIIQMGGSFLFNSTVTNINFDKTIKSIVINNEKEIMCDALILAIGHSARDTFNMLYTKKVQMEAKAFAVGLRVQHNQNMINLSQHGTKYASQLGAASYKLTYKSSDGRGVYSFCMCPGGFVVNASSEIDHLAVNGMSNQARDEENANSAIIVTIGPEDFGFHPLDGIRYQKKLEHKAYELGKGLIPIQLLKDYNNNEVSNDFGLVKPLIKGKYTFANLNELFDKNINNSLKESFSYFGSKIKGFDKDDTLLAGVESRTSSPVKILRNENYESNIPGIYPCGEGAGYAGGITSAAIDGIKVAEAIAKKYQ